MKRFTSAAIIIGVAALPGAFAATAALGAAPASDEIVLAKADETNSSDADKRAKAADCSKQADAKNLHGAERKKFREACKRK